MTCRRTCSADLKSDKIVHCRGACGSTHRTASRNAANSVDVDDVQRQGLCCITVSSAGIMTGTALTLDVTEASLTICVRCWCRVENGERAIRQTCLSNVQTALKPSCYIRFSGAEVYCSPRISNLKTQASAISKTPFISHSRYMFLVFLHCPQCTLLVYFEKREDVPRHVEKRTVRFCQYGN